MVFHSNEIRELTKQIGKLEKKISDSNKSFRMTENALANIGQMLQMNGILGLRVKSTPVVTDDEGDLTLEEGKYAIIVDFEDVSAVLPATKTKRVTDKQRAQMGFMNEGEDDG